MVNESDEKYDDQEEGEYHFSDDHVNYEVDNETVKVADAAVAKTSPLSGLTKYRRMLIAMVVFLIIMFIVYKMLSPAGPMEGNTEITEAMPSAVTTPAAAPAVKTVTKITTSTAPISAQPTPNFTGSTPTAPPPILAQPTVSPAPTPNPTVTTTISAPAANASDSTKELIDRLANLEQQNAKLTNVLQIEYAQKMTDYENQNTSTQTKLKDLSTRIANIEAALTQLTQLLQNTGGKLPATAALPATKMIEPKQTYSVQAIIPGRAWLKSDSGETVTVAEGDVLRDYGRISKIDPYDGVVDIDTGSKTISLSYGANSE